MITVYHNPKCRKSRAGLQYIAGKGLQHTVVDYQKVPFAPAQFKELLMKLNKRPAEILRTQEDVFKERFQDKKFTDEEWINIMIEHPRLIQRPIVVNGYKAVIGNPPELIDSIL